MRAQTMVSVERSEALESATRVAVVGALSATTMLFASLVSAYLVRRSFADWRPSGAAWPFALLTCGLWASSGMEIGVRSEGRTRTRAFKSLALASSLYLLLALVVIASVAFGPGGLTPPYQAFVVLLLGVHVVHATLGAGFAMWILRDTAGRLAQNRLFLGRLVTHFLTLLLFAIVFLLFVLR